MEAPKAKFVVDAVNVIQERVSAESDAWDKFTVSLKSVLDSRFGGEWNILIGKAVGYAMKTKKKAHVVAVSSSGEIVICWKSPGFEVEDVNIVKLKAEQLLNPKSDSAEKQTTSKLNVISSPTPDSPTYTSNTPKAISLVDGLIDDIRSMETQEAARHLRNHLTARLGTIWHVAIGETRAFHVSPAASCMDHIVLASKKGGVKIEVFRHKQPTATGISATLKEISWPAMRTIFDIIPSLFFIALCITFLLQKSPACRMAVEYNSNITQSACTFANSVPIAPLAGIVFVLVLLKQVKKQMDKKKLKHQ